ncbi:hypothetical protein BC936DRAFT_138925 [Jimgerdemannia flammicorona]|uniref:Uncharacterized protein n=1 Tax=Jimgerdemannia flammicorona TaxID=994334 RepID=A0A433DI00_9FUNG|nr:hypothetical protein BC936DRAFT_138925 [Jimgerdemannia flammicorona]
MPRNRDRTRKRRVDGTGSKKFLGKWGGIETKRRMEWVASAGSQIAVEMERGTGGTGRTGGSEDRRSGRWLQKSSCVFFGLFSADDDRSECVHAVFTTLHEQCQILYLLISAAPTKNKLFLTTVIVYFMTLYIFSLCSLHICISGSFFPTFSLSFSLWFSHFNSMLNVNYFFLYNIFFSTHIYLLANHPTSSWSSPCFPSSSLQKFCVTKETDCTLPLLFTTARRFHCPSFVRPNVYI